MWNINKYRFRYQIITLLDQGFYTAMDAAWEPNLSIRHTRKVDKYNSFGFEGFDYLIDPKNCEHFNGCLSACRIELYATPEIIIVYHQGKLIQKFKKQNTSN